MRRVQLNAILATHTSHVRGAEHRQTTNVYCHCHPSVYQAGADST